MTENREAVVVACSECDHGHYFERVDGMGECAHCGHTVNPSVDVEPYLDEGESLLWTDDTRPDAPRLLAYIPAND